jgi:AcrR family transcriptional regulator
MARMSAHDRRRVLIDAALTVMAREGVAAATTRAIVAEADMALASFHYCFRSRDEMLGELITVVVDREVEAALRSMEGGTDLGTTLRSGLHGYLAHIEQNPGHELVLFELNHYALRTPDLRGLADEQYRLYYQAATDVLSAAAEQAGVRWRRELTTIARVVITVLDGATTTWLVDRDTEATRAALDSVVDLLVSLAEPISPSS